MPPYTPIKSKSQSRALFAAARRGELSMDDAKGKTAAADFSKLPERVKKKAGRTPARPSTRSTARSSR